MTGWIKLHRQFTEWEWYRHTPTKVVFMHLLLKANIEDRRYQGHEVPAGSLVTGVNALAEQTDLTVMQVRTALKNLQNTGEITIKTTNKFSIISISNWAKFQETNTQITNKQQTDNNQITTPKEYKNKEYTVVDTRVDEKPRHVHIGERIAKITGWDKSPNWFGDYSRIEQWLADGWDEHLDILPTVTRIMANRTGPPGSLKYFERAIAEHRQARLSPLPKAEGGKHVTDSKFRKYTVQDARREALAELGILEDDADCPSGGTDLRGSGHLRQATDSRQNHDQNHGGGFTALLLAANPSGLHDMAQDTDENPYASRHLEPYRA